MTTTSLETFVARTRAAWGPLSTELVAECRANFGQLLRASPAEPWLAALHRDLPANAELHRDPDHGFILLGHTEQAGLYRPPHDHGRSWVIYAIQRGAVEMGSYARIEQPCGAIRLVKRDATLVRAGQVMAYLPGDIHDTLCVEGPALVYRFTERDLKQEDREGRLTRYVERGGLWTASAA